MDRIEEENVNVQDMSKGTIKKKKIIIGVPGDNFSSKYFISFVSILNYLWDTGKYDIVISPGVSSFVTFARMKTMGLDVMKGIDQKPFDGMDFDIFVTIDSDIVFSPQNFVELIDAVDTHDVVSGIYRMADLKNFAVVQKLDPNYFKEHSTYEYLTQETIDKWKSENTDNKFMKVAYCGMGFMAISKDALSSLTYPYFHSELQELRGKDGKMLRDLCSEDFAFCANLRKNNYDIHVIPTLRVGHIKPLVI
jgi:hypothetical protein